jgi:para-nitrobenzyl esterase
MRVATTAGLLEGAASDGVVRFLGVPYACARRFAAPEPHPGWTGVRDATVHGPQCPQVLGLLEQAVGAAAIPQSEECLTLALTTPACDDGGRPVVVWIHGGAFVTGTGAMPWYDGGSLARRGDVVVVSINYRLGVLGFLGRSNVGLADQVAALRWVHDEVAAFGGDPGNVTIVGESAGGASVLALLATDATDGLIHRAWAMSPSIGQFRTAERADELAARVVSAAGVLDVDDLDRCDIETLLRAQSEVLGAPDALFDGFSPTWGTPLLPEPVTVAAARRRIPLVIGTTRDEMHLVVMLDPELDGLDENGVRALVEDRFPGRSDETLEVYRAHRPDASPREIWSAIQTDELFRVPAQRFTAARVAAGTPTWSTWFTWQSTGMGGVLGACHGLDIPFAFDNLDRPQVELFTGPGADRQVVADVHADALLTFVRTGVANWDPVSAPGTPTLRIDVVTEQIDDPEPGVLHLWSSLQVHS